MFGDYAFSMVGLSRPCDACGKMIGGGFKYCPKCQIYLCFLCSYQLMCSQNKYPVECPMCGGKPVSLKEMSPESICLSLCLKQLIIGKDEI